MAGKIIERRGEVQQVWYKNFLMGIFMLQHVQILGEQKTPALVTDPLDSKRGFDLREPRLHCFLQVTKSILGY